GHVEPEGGATGGVNSAHHVVDAAVGDESLARPETRGQGSFEVVHGERGDGEAGGEGEGRGGTGGEALGVDAGAGPGDEGGAFLVVLGVLDQPQEFGFQ